MHRLVVRLDAAIREPSRLLSTIGKGTEIVHAWASSLDHSVLPLMDDSSNAECNPKDELIYGDAIEDDNLRILPL